MPIRPNTPDDPDDAEPIKAMDVLRSGVRATPELKAGFAASLTFALVIAVGRLVVPIAIQQILDKGISDGTPDWGFIAWTGAAAATAIIALAILNKITYYRLMRTAENVLYGLRTRAFGHVHELSIGHHNEAKKGVLVSRVTSDIETLAQFASWGAVSWAVNSTMIVVALAMTAFYSWQLALVLVAVLLPVLPIMRMVQRRQLKAYDALRTSVGDTLSEISETVGGIRVIRAYGDVRAARRRLHDRIDTQYRAQVRARFFFAIMFPVSDVFSGLALAAVVGVGVWWGPGWGLQAGTLVAIMFLTNLIVQPVAELGEVLDQTQTALAGWRKVLRLMDEPVEVAEPSAAAAVTLPPGALDVRVEAVEFAYEPGHPVLHGIDLEVRQGEILGLAGLVGAVNTLLGCSDETLCDVFYNSVPLHQTTTGSFLIGVLAGLGAGGGRAGTDSFRQFFIVGLCGGYTTFSAFSIQTLDLIRDHQLLTAGGNVLLSVTLCLIAVWLGHLLGVAASR